MGFPQLETKQSKRDWKQRKEICLSLSLPENTIYGQTRVMENLMCLMQKLEVIFPLLILQLFFSYHCIHPG